MGEERREEKEERHFDAMEAFGVKLWMMAEVDCFSSMKSLVVL